MPTPEELEFDKAVGAAPSEEVDEEAAFDQAVGASPEDAEGSLASPAMQEAVAFQGEDAPEAPSKYEYKEKAIGDEPWQNAWESVRDQPAFTALENVASGANANTSDEIQSAILNPPDAQDPANAQALARKALGAPLPETEKNTYAAGSRAEDNRLTFENEKAERDAINPKSAFGGQLLGGAVQAAALPEAALTTFGGGAAAGAVLTAANYMGQGRGNLSQRADQAMKMADDHPVATLASVAVPALVGKAAGAMKSAAPVLAEKAALNRTAAVMTPAQRSAHMDNFGGKAGLVRLGDDMEAAGLHKRDPTAPGWYPRNWVPGSAETVHTNAVDLRRSAGKQLGEAEEVIAAHNPPIKVGDISQDLRGGADDLNGSWRSTAAADQAERRRMASMIDDSTTQLPGTPGPEPVRPVARPPEGPWTPEQPPVYASPSPEEIAAYEAKLPPPEYPTQQPKEGPWTPEIPEQKASPEDWASYLETVKSAPEGAALPPGPVNQPYVPARGPGVVEPGAADFRKYNKALQAHQNPGPAPTPKLVQEAVPSKPPGEAVVTDRDWKDYLLAEKMFKNPDPVPSGEMGFKDAVRQRRELDLDTNFTKAGGVENAGVKEQIARQTGTALRKNIRAGLGDAAAQNPELAKPVQDWNTGNKNFSLAATVEDPAQIAMMKEYGGGFGLRDMAKASALNAMGVPAPLASVGSSALKGGRGANALAGTQRTLSKAFHGLGVGAGPTALAGTQATLPDPEVNREKNEDLKSQVNEAVKGAWNWATQWNK